MESRGGGPPRRLAPLRVLYPLCRNLAVRNWGGIGLCQPWSATGRKEACAPRLASRGYSMRFSFALACLSIAAGVLASNSTTSITTPRGMAVVPPKVLSLL